MQKILVINGDTVSRQALSALLVAEEYAVIAADDGASGLALALEHRPDLMVVQAELPDMEGHQLLETLQTCPDIAVVPCILISDRADMTDLRKSMDRGAADCLLQPFTHAELLSAIKTRLAKQAALAERYVTILRHTAERLNRLAHYDSLTDLPNHHLLYQRLSQAIKVAKAEQHCVALLSLSLDRLRQVNNILGFRAGDQMLQATAQRLSACLPKATTVARLTGNQFVVLISKFSDPKTIHEVADEILDCLSRPFSLPGQEVFATISIGIAIYPDDSEDVKEILRQADAALEWAKHQKSNYVQFYRSDIPVVSSDAISLETALRYAVEREEFSLYYQPQMNTHSGLIAGAEALIRWPHPTEGYISPAQFVPLAEETGLIVPIGEWLFRKACTQIRQWQSIGLPPLQLSINLSSVQFNQPDLTELITDILHTTQLDPACLELEITETALMQDAEAAIAILKALKALGPRIAIDDFGTGYSSLSYLKQFPIDTLKIDNCFVRGVIADPKNQAIVKSVIQMAHSLDLTVIAEGIETEEELAFLADNHCDVVQGYFISRPLDATDMQACLTAQDPWSTIKGA
ncbi:MAG: EAL domain-containing protein [Cyanobacteria bacterium J06639_16]